VRVLGALVPVVEVGVEGFPAKKKVGVEEVVNVQVGNSYASCFA
jgi:hypothetical protein